MASGVNWVTVTLGSCFLLMLLVLVGCESEAQRIREVNELVGSASEEKDTLSAQVDVLNIENGDCIDSTLPEGISIETVVIVPCFGPWQYRVLNSFSVEGPNRYPGESFFTQRAYESCDRHFTHVLFPLPESWNLGDRTVNCLQQAFGLSVADPDKLDRLVGYASMRSGECFNEAFETGGVQVELVDCSEGWQYRVLGSFELTGIDGYPREAFFSQSASERCDPRYTEFLFPDPENWGFGDRSVNCIQESFGLSVLDPGKLDRLADIDSLNLGECFNEAPETDGVKVEMVDCSGTWDYRMLNSFEVAGNSNYPGDDFFRQRARDRCNPKYTSTFPPNAETWRYGDRSINCVQESFGLSVLDPDKLNRLVNAKSLDVGECYNEAPETGGVQVELVDCSGPWQYRVLNSFDVAELASYPGDSFFDQAANDRCRDDTTSFRYPSVDTWDYGDRTVICLQERP